MSDYFASDVAPIGTHDGDAMAADTRVALEDDVAALIDRQAVILVVDRASKKISLVSYQKLIYMGRGIPVLNCQVGCAAVEAVRVVPSGLPVALGVGRVTSSCTKLYGYLNLVARHRCS